MCTYVLFTFTDFVPKIETKLECGWCLIGLTLATLGVNMGILFGQTIYQLIRTIKLKYNKRKYFKIMEKRRIEREKQEMISSMV